MSFITNVLCKCFASHPSFDPRSSLVRNITLTINTPLGIEKHGIFFTFIPYIVKKGKTLKIL